MQKPNRAPETRSPVLVALTFCCMASAAVAATAGGPHGGAGGYAAGGAHSGGRFGGGGRPGHGGYRGGYGGGWNRAGWGGHYFGGGLIYGAFYDPWYWPAYGVEYAPSALIAEPLAEQEVPPSEFTYRYFCPTSRDYYPNVATCTVPWLRVVPDR